MQSQIGKYTLSFISNVPRELHDDLDNKVFKSFHRIPKEGWSQDLAEDFATDRIQEWYGRQPDWIIDPNDSWTSFKVLLKTVESEPKEFIVTVQVDAEYSKDYYVYAIKPKKSENG